MTRCATGLVPVLALSLALPALLVGCGKASKSAVSGNVTLDGKSAGGGQVHFKDKEGNKVSAAITPDGKYRTELPPGEYTAYLEAPDISPLAKFGGGTAGAPPKDIAPLKDPTGQIPTAVETAAIKLAPWNLPMRYKNADSSGLTLTVASTDQTFDIQMKSK